MHCANFGFNFTLLVQRYMVTIQVTGQTILLQVHQGNRTFYLRYTIHMASIWTNDNL